jgi:hypothetical protein
MIEEVSTPYAIGCIVGAKEGKSCVGHEAVYNVHRCLPGLLFCIGM